VKEILQEAVQHIHNVGYDDLVKIECHLEGFLICGKLAVLDTHASVHHLVRFDALEASPPYLRKRVKHVCNFIARKRGEA
jgi:hypothetical protein